MVQEFCSSFADQEREAVLPEFMKPAGHRRSQVGTVWGARHWTPHHQAMNERAAVEIAAVSLLRSTS
jgi:hypothetical protein